MRRTRKREYAKSRKRKNRTLDRKKRRTNRKRVSKKTKRRSDGPKASQEPQEPPKASQEPQEPPKASPEPQEPPKASQEPQEPPNASQEPQEHAFSGRFIYDWTEDNQEIKLTDYPTKDEIKSRFRLECPDGGCKKDKGSVNIIEFYNISGDDKSKRVVRVAEKPVFELVKVSGSDSNYHLVTIPFPDSNLIEEKQSFYNWKFVNDEELCPKIYFYGYIRDAENMLYLCQVSDAYASNLEKYYEEGAGKITQEELTNAKLRPVDINIANQLISALKKVGKSPLNLICFDIKPANIVIRGEGPTLEVKLIDWDGDWCVPFFNSDNVEQPVACANPEEYSDLIGIINIMIMANHFLKKFHWNIFYDYFTSGKWKHYMPSLTDTVLKELFCNKRKISKLYGDMRKFEYFAKFYLLSTESGQAMDCYEIFTTMWNNSLKLQNGIL